MLTVKHVMLNGAVEHITEALSVRVEFDIQSAKDPDAPGRVTKKVRQIHIDHAPSESRIKRETSGISDGLIDGQVYIMNEAGRTVASYKMEPLPFMTGTGGTPNNTIVWSQGMAEPTVIAGH